MPPAPPAAAAAAHEQLVLAVTLNTVPGGDVFVWRTPDAGLLMKLTDLQALGLQVGDAPTLPVDGEAHVDLRTIRGLKFRVLTTASALEMDADPALLPSREINLYPQRRASIAHAPGLSGFVNYAVEADKIRGSGAQHHLTLEGGLRMSEYLLLTDAATVRQTDGSDRLVRLTSRLLRDDLQTLQRVVVGDFYSPSSELGTSVNLGGLGISKQYGLDPYVLRQPLSDLRAQVAVPSEVEVLVDGQRVRTERVLPGEFQLRDLYGYGGARDVQLLVRDAFGRVQQLDYSVYFTDQPLRAGHHEYSYGIGALRRNFGLASNDYGPAAWSGYHRYGLTDAVTLGLRAEGRREVSNAGALGTFVLGSAGVLTASLAASRAPGLEGRASGLSYNYQLRGFSSGFSVRRDSRGYATLTDPLTLTNRRREASAYVSFHVPAMGTWTLSQSILDVHATTPLPAGFVPTTLTPQKVTSLRYSTPLVSGWANLLFTLNRVHDTSGVRHEVAANVTIFLERDRTVQTGIRGVGDGYVAETRLIRNPGAGEGHGYDLGVDRGIGKSEDSLQLRMAGQLNLARAVVRAEAERSRSGGSLSEAYRASVSGSLAFIDGRVHAGRPIVDSFGLVRAGELADVPVTLNGQSMGRTDDSGTLLVPSMASFYDNEVAVDQTAIPIDYAVARVAQRVAPLYRSGVVVDFGVSRIRTATGRLVRLVDGQAQPLALQDFTLRVGDKDLRSMAGRGGEIYLENVPAGRHAGRTGGGSPACVFEVAVPATDESFVELGDIACR